MNMTIIATIDNNYSDDDDDGINNNAFNYFQMCILEATT